MVLAATLGATEGMMNYRIQYPRLFPRAIR
jgi:hypothetical protein